jgi:radical SAM-linked protein
VVQKLRIRYAKRGRLRFTSHRDFARVFERAIRRAQIPIAFSAGFSPHPKVSYAGATPTGTASEAEYLEIGLARASEPDQVRDALDAALPAGIDIVEVIDAATSPAKTLAELIEASQWTIELPGVSVEQAQQALDALLAVQTAPVERATKDGTRTVDVRASLRSARVSLTSANGPEMNAGCARMDVVVQHSTPAVRPDDILTALRSIGALSTPVTPVVTRLAQGLIDSSSPEDAQRLTDPFSGSGRSDSVVSP